MRRIFLFLLVILFHSFGYTQNSKPVIAKEPSWVTFNTVDYNESQLDYEAEDGSIDILYDQQMFPEQQSVFCRRIIKILTESGIQSSSEVSINFDPSYQQLILHKINIRRGDKIINQLNLSKIKTIQQEKDLHRYLYDGSLSSVTFLEDVRKGDVIEYSYTKKGFNPIFKGKFTEIVDLGFSVPMYNVYYKLITSNSRNLKFKNRNTDIKPVVENNGSEIIYQWRLSNLKAFHPQDGIPGWYDPYATVQISDYSSWKDVNYWAMELFPDYKNISLQLRKRIEDIKANNSGAEKQILAALRFVQDDIRYMGIEMGVNSHKPASPNKILEQRFGDCKDKSYLLCTILKQIGIEASPVLVNTVDRKAITEWLPSDNAFDHVTVRVKYGDKYHWFDPTISFQRGSIDDISFPDYQCGLVIDSATADLTLIDFKEPGMVKVNEVFDIKDMSGDAKLTVTTVYNGSFADNARNDFNSTSIYELLKNYKEYYNGYYEHITADSITYTDNEKTGFFVSKEFYTIHDIWEIKSNVKEASFDAFVINGIIRKPKETIRTMPFSIAYPAHYKEQIEINMPDDWDGKESFKQISTSSFLMTADFTYSNKKFVLRYDYQNLKNTVLPTEIKAFMDGLKEKDAHTAYVLTTSLYGKPLANSNVTEPSANNNGYNLSAILLVLVFIGFVIWRYRKG